MTAAKRRAVAAFLDRGGRAMLVRESTPPDYATGGTSEVAHELARINALDVSEREKTYRIAEVAAAYRAEAMLRAERAAEIRAEAYRIAEQTAAGRQQAMSVPEMEWERVEPATQPQE